MALCWSYGQTFLLTPLCATWLCNVERGRCVDAVGDPKPAAGVRVMPLSSPAASVCHRLHSSVSYQQSRQVRPGTGCCCCCCCRVIYCISPDGATLCYNTTLCDYNFPPLAVIMPLSVTHHPTVRLAKALCFRALRPLRSSIRLVSSCYHDIS